MITFPVLFINLLSIFVMGGVLVAIYSVKGKHAAIELFIASSWMLLWAISSFLEMINASFPAKLLWRNITQIGVFFTPAASFIFALAYTGYLAPLKRKIAIGAYAFQSLPIILIFTNDLHHLMRSSVSLVQGQHYQIIGVQTTVLGKVFISGNFIFMLLSFVVILFALFHVREVDIKQMLSVLLGMGISLFYALLKVSTDGRLLEIVPISGIFALSGFFMLLGIHRFDLLKITPLAHAKAFSFLGEGIIICAADAQVLDANPAAKKLLGESAWEIGEHLRNLVPRWYETALQGTEQAFEIVLGEHYLYAKLYPIMQAKGELIGSITLIEDVTAEKERAQLLRNRAEIDSMSGLFNRPTFIEQVERLLLQAKTSAQFIYFDIDHFKDVNDRWGHRAGDAIICDLGAFIVSSMPKGCLAGRMGGEEFALFCIDLEQEVLLSYAEKLRFSIAGKLFLYEGQQISLTISLGVVSAVDSSFDELYREADRLLYKAKRDGRNCIRFETLENTAPTGQSNKQALQ